MKTARPLIASLLLLLWCSACAGTGESKEAKAAKDDLARILAWPDESGGVYTQGKMDGVDYRAILKGAIHKNKADLAAIFSYTGKGWLQGEGAETNISVLHDLLVLWGDHEFSMVLRAAPKQTQESVITFLREDYQFKDSQFPETTGLVPRG